MEAFSNRSWIVDETFMASLTFLRKRAFSATPGVLNVWFTHWDVLVRNLTGQAYPKNLSEWAVHQEQ